MIYLILQIASLLTVCALAFFGVGWAAHKWVERRNPWRVPPRKPKAEDTSDPIPASTDTAVDILQTNFKKVSDQLAEKNNELQAQTELLRQTELLLKTTGEETEALRNELTALRTKYDSQKAKIEELLARIVELEKLIDTQVHATSDETEILRSRVAELEKQLSEVVIPVVDPKLTLQKEPIEELAMEEDLLVEWESSRALPEVDAKPAEEALAPLWAEMLAPPEKPPVAAPKIQAPVAPLFITQPVELTPAASREDARLILERMDELERQLGEKTEAFLKKDETLETELKARLMSLEEMLQNLRAESEMALLAQLDFQTKAVESESEERRKWEDLEHELELRMSQLELELSGVRKADQLIAQISEQVEEKLRDQLHSLTSEVSEIKNTWNHQEEEFKNRDEQILGNLDRLQTSLNKLGVRIEEDHASVPDSVLQEMEELKGDILSSIPEKTSATAKTVPASPVPAGIASQLQKLLEEKDLIIRSLDQKIQEMSKKLDPQLVGRDDLELINGIGPYIRRILEKEFGISSFKQIVLMNAKQMEAISSRLFFKNKIQKENWIGQAAALHQKKYDEEIENPNPPYRRYW